MAVWNIVMPIERDFTKILLYMTWTNKRLLKQRSCIMNYEVCLTFQVRREGKKSDIIISYVAHLSGKDEAVIWNKE